MTHYLNTVINRKQTPQSLPIPGTSQAPNSAGGFAWAVDDWTRLDRFLILGSEGGSYYATEQALSRENADAVVRCVAQDGLRAVERIVEISVAGRAPKNDPALSASKPEMTSNSSSSMPSWRKRWNVLLSSSNSSSMFLSARCIAARRLAFSLARDSAHARKSETKRYSRMSARKVAVPPPMTSGKILVGQGSSANSRRQVSSSGSSR